jgi:hypothetical protein
MKRNTKKNGREREWKRENKNEGSVRENGREKEWKRENEKKHS